MPTDETAAAPETTPEGPETAAEPDTTAIAPEVEPEPTEALAPIRLTEVNVVVKKGKATATVGEFAGSIVGVAIGDADVKWTAEHLVTGIATITVEAKVPDGPAVAVVSVTAD